jgi:TM2 domain-containing membrane protein YozV
MIGTGKPLKCPSCNRRITRLDDSPRPQLPEAPPIRRPPELEPLPLAEVYASEPSSAEEIQTSEEQPDEKGPDRKYCHECGAIIRSRAVVCPKCGVEQPRQRDDYRDSDGAGSTRLTAAIFALLFGGLGVHKFYLGRTGTGLTMLLLTLGGIPLGFLTCGLGFILPGAMHLIALIEGIMYLSKTDEQFYNEYIVGGRSWS